MIFSKKEAQSVVNTIIGKELKIETTKLTGSGSVRIDGKVIGDVELDGSLTIGESGYVQGNVYVNYVYIAGSLTGDLYCQGKAHMSSTARIVGNVEAISIVMDEGAMFDGRCHTNLSDSKVFSTSNSSTNTNVTDVVDAVES